MSDARSIVPGLSREEELILCCARTQLDDAARTRLHQLAKGALDWKRVGEIARLHRLRPLVFKHLKAENLWGVAPAEIWAGIQRHAAMIIGRNLSQANELTKILRRLREGGIEAIPFKGPVLALRSYGNLGLREFVDMDLLLRKNDILKAKKILQELGFTSPWKQNEEWEAQHIDTQLGCDFSSADRRVQLELHWSFIQKWLSYEVDLDSIWARAQVLDLAGLPVKIISREDLLIYLCAHGAKHHWERLFWIIDIAEIVRGEKNMDWERLILDARRHGSWRVVALGLHLAKCLLNAPVPDKVWTEVNRDQAVSQLARSVGAWLFNEEKRPASGAWVETRFYLNVKERLADRAAYSWHLLKLAMAPSDKDRAFVKLPAAFAFLYPVVRPIRWLVQR